MADHGTIAERAAPPNHLANHITMAIGKLDRIFSDSDDQDLVEAAALAKSHLTWCLGYIEGRAEIARRGGVGPEGRET